MSPLPSYKSTQEKMTEINQWVNLMLGTRIYGQDLGNNCIKYTKMTSNKVHFCNQNYTMQTSPKLLKLGTLPYAKI